MQPVHRHSIPQVLRALALGGAALIGSAGTSAFAAPRDDDRKPATVETESIFGFTEGSDTGEAGERELSYGLLGRQRARANRYGAVQNDLRFEHSLSDDLKLGLGTFLDAYRSSRRAVPESDAQDARDALPLSVQDDDTGTADISAPALTRRSLVTGLSAEAKYRILERGQDSPFGLAVSFEPEWRRAVSGRGTGTSLIQFQTKIMADAAIIPDRLFFAVNASWEPQVTRTPENATVRDSNSEISAALAARLSERLFIGGELRYLVSFEGFSLSNVTDTGVFVGPTVFANLSERASMSAAWSVRVGGQIRSEPEPVPDFGNVPDPLERHHVRLRFSYTF